MTSNSQRKQRKNNECRESEIDKVIGDRQTEAENRRTLAAA